MYVINRMYRKFVAAVSTTVVATTVVVMTLASPRQETKNKWQEIMENDIKKVSSRIKMDNSYVTIRSGDYWRGMFQTSDIPRARPGHTPLSLAAICKHEEMVEMLLKAGAKPTGDFMMENAVRNNLKIVKMLNEATLDAEEKEVKSPMILGEAVKFGQVDIAEYLIDQGANVTEPGRFDCTPLTMAAYNCDTKMIQMLLDKGAKSSIDRKPRREYFGQTPLTAAVNCGCASGLRMLLKNGANNDIRNNLGFTPLEMVDELRTKGISTEILNEMRDVLQGN
jgi:ankyrin repeat protein